MEHSERSAWDLVESVSILFMRGFLKARSRAFEYPMPMVRLLAQRDHAHTDSVLLERELAIYRSQRHCKSPKHRPHYSPQERSEILQLMRLRGWSCKEAAARFIVHPNTIRNWKRAPRDKLKADKLVGAPPWNKLYEGVRWLVHEIRQLCPERDFGTRTIARHIIRSGIQISRASVRQILEEKSRNPSSTIRKFQNPRSSTAPNHLFNLNHAHQVWHMDMTTVRVLWMRYEIAAIIDGSSRKNVGLRVFQGTPSTCDLLYLIDHTITQNTVPRFVITDRGGRFQTTFFVAMIQRGIKHARAPARVWQFNAKVERLFWS